MRILVLSPHTDDAQLGAGGSVARWVREGHDVYEMCFSFVETLGDEWRAAMKLLGVREYDHMDIPPRHFPAHRQEILERMVIAAKENWDWVLCPSTYDTHQDHEVIRAEAFRAFKAGTLVGYELPWNCISTSATMFTVLQYEDVVAKRDACKCYKSQVHRSYASPVTITNWASTTGMRFHTKYAEAFEVIRLKV